MRQHENIHDMKPSTKTSGNDMQLSGCIMPTSIDIKFQQTRWFGHDCIEQRPSSEACSCWFTREILRFLYNPKVLFPWSQERATGTCSEPDEYSLHTSLQPISSRSV